MKRIIFLMCIFGLVGCANMDTQDCRKRDGFISCEPKKEPNNRPDRYRGI